MSVQVTNGTGKLYDAKGKEVIATVDYTIWHNPSTKSTLGEWHGDFIPEDEHLFIQGEGEYVIELQDKRKGKIIVTNIEIQPGVPTHYQFQGSGSLIL